MMSTAMLERSSLGGATCELPVIRPEFETPETDKLLARMRAADYYQGWDTGSRAIIDAWNFHEATEERVVTETRRRIAAGAIANDDGTVRREYVPAFYPTRAEGFLGRGQADTERVWALRDFGIADPDTLELPEYTQAYWQINDIAFKGLREARPRWQRVIGWGRSKDKRRATRAAEYMLLGDAADDWLKPDVSLVPRGAKQLRRETIAENLSTLKPLIGMQLATSKLQTKIGKWAEKSPWRKAVIAGIGASAVGGAMSGLMAGVMELLPSESQLSDIAASLVGLDEQTRR